MKIQETQERFCECPKCGEISLSNTPEESTKDSYIQEFYCECGYMETRINHQYEAELEKQRQWWAIQNADDEWISKNG